MYKLVTQSIFIELPCYTKGKKKEGSYRREKLKDVSLNKSEWINRKAMGLPWRSSSSKIRRLEFAGKNRRTEYVFQRQRGK